jgi:hypothetical protein
MIDQTKTFSLNVHMHEGFDCDGVHLESRNLTKDSRSIVGLISMPIEPFAPKNNVTPNDLNEETKITPEVLKVQFILNQKAWVPHHRLSLPWHFFVVNDGSMPNLILLQTMCCVICHYACQSFSVGNTIKRRKGMISYN